MSEHKICPYCSESIKVEAVKCRFCREWLNKTHNNDDTENAPTSQINNSHESELGKEEKERVDYKQTEEQVIHMRSKIPGFRSGVLWKKIIASSFYVFVFFIFIGTLTSDSGREENTTGGNRSVAKEPAGLKEEEIYLDKLMELSTEIDSLNSDFALHIDSYDKSQNWAISSQDYIKSYIDIISRFRALRPPEEFKSSHFYLMEAMDGYEKAMDIFSEGLLTPSTVGDCFSDMAFWINTANDAARQSLEEMKAMNY